MAMDQDASRGFVAQFFKRLRAECVPLIERSTVPFYGIQEDQIKRDRTGVLYKVAGHHFILTASHGLRPIVENDIPLYVDSTDDSTLPIPIVGAVFHTTEEDGRDVAAIKLPDEVAYELARSKQFLTHSDVREIDTRSNSLYFFFGYPGDWFAGATETALVSEPLAYACRRYIGETNPNEHYDPDVHVVLEFSQAAVDPLDKSSHQLPRLHGVSGCGVWRITEWSKEGFEGWRPDQFCLVALQHSWSRQRKYIKGTWLGYALALIRENYPEVSAAMKLIYPKG